MNIEHSSLINYFRKRNKLDSEEIEFLNKIFEIKTYDSKEILLKKGDVCKNIYFIEEGVVKTYFIDEDEKVIQALKALREVYKGGFIVTNQVEKW
jgi:CRP-like cAMP-binding protein